MKELSFSDMQHLDAAEGWTGLGSFADAQAELEQISPDFQGHPLVLEGRYKVYAGTRCWEPALAMAEAVRRTLPDNFWGYFHTAYALHELKRTQEAYDTLAPMAGKFPEDHLMRFNLACYACQLGRFDESMQWLKAAMALADDEDLQKQALEDRDLEPLWQRIKEMGEP